MKRHIELICRGSKNQRAIIHQKDKLKEKIDVFEYDVVGTNGFFDRIIDSTTIDINSQGIINTPTGDKIYPVNLCDCEFCV